MLIKYVLYYINKITHFSKIYYTVFLHYFMAIPQVHLETLSFEAADKTVDKSISKYEKSSRG